MRLLLLTLAVPIFFDLSAYSRTLIDKTLVTVNEDVILETDVAEFQKKLRSKSFQELFGGIQPGVAEDSRLALQLLIDEKIIDQQVRRLELRATDPEIDAQIRSILKRNGISSSQLNERLRQLGTTVSEYREGIRRQLERKNLLDREVRPTLEVSEEQVRHFYQRISQGTTPEMEYKIAHILVQTESKAKSVFESLKRSPERFEQAAKSNSTDSSTSDQGGVLGTFSTTALAKEFREAIPKVAIGQIAPPIRTGAGFHIIKILEIRTSEFTSLPKERKDSIRNQLLEEEMERKMRLWLERKRTESYIKFPGAPDEG